MVDQQRVQKTKSKDGDNFISKLGSRISEQVAQCFDEFDLLHADSDADREDDDSLEVQISSSSSNDNLTYRGAAITNAT